MLDRVAPVNLQLLEPEFFLLSTSKLNSYRYFIDHAHASGIFEGTQVKFDLE